MLRMSWDIRSTSSVKQTLLEFSALKARDLSQVLLGMSYDFKLYQYDRVWERCLYGICLTLLEGFVCDGGGILL